jgi:hypothetical protein
VGGSSHGSLLYGWLINNVNNGHVCKRRYRKSKQAGRRYFGIHCLSHQII